MEKKLQVGRKQREKKKEEKKSRVNGWIGNGGLGRIGCAVHAEVRARETEQNSKTAGELRRHCKSIPPSTSLGGGGGVELGACRYSCKKRPVWKCRYTTTYNPCSIARHTRELNGGTSKIWRVPIGGVKCWWEKGSHGSNKAIEFLVAAALEQQRQFISNKREVAAVPLHLTRWSRGVAPLIELYISDFDFFSFLFFNLSTVIVCSRLGLLGEFFKGHYFKITHFLIQIQSESLPVLNKI